MATGWSFPEMTFDNHYIQRDDLKETGFVINDGLERLKSEPHRWAGLQYQSNMVDWPEEQQQWTLFARESGIQPIETENGTFTFIGASYTALPPATFVDSVSDTQEMGTYKGQVLEWKRPGRGEGVGDIPSLKLFGDIDPEDIIQGQVGDCWMISAISALAEFDGEVQSLFRERQLSPEGKYTVRLFDLPSQQFKDVVIDDRLACKDGSLLACKPTADDEIWPVLLEKAFVVHAGGWDKIDGGQSTTALAVLTGCMDTFTVQNVNFQSGEAGSFRKLDSQWDKFDENNCHCQAAQQLWGGYFPSGEQELGEDEFFDLLCEWDSQNFVVCAATGAGSDTNNTDGIVDGHAYSLISAKKQVCGKFDLLLFRNPHAKTEYEGGWRDGGEQWAANPDVKAELGHKEDPDDGLFWMDKADAFRYFGTFFVCCKRMQGTKEPEPQDRGIKSRAIVLKRADPALKLASTRVQSAGGDGCLDSLCPPEPPRPAPLRPQTSRSLALPAPAPAQAPQRSAAAPTLPPPQANTMDPARGTYLPGPVPFGSPLLLPPSGPHTLGFPGPLPVQGGFPGMPVGFPSPAMAPFGVPPAPVLASGMPPPMVMQGFTSPYL